MAFDDRLQSEADYVVGTTAQIAALTCHLNARLRGIATPKFFPGNSTCQFCEWIQFLHLRRGWLQRNNQWEVVFRTPDEWMDSIISGGPSRVLLIHSTTDDPKISDRTSAGFVCGGGRWLLCIEHGKGTDCWQARWQVGNREAHDKRIWRVEYGLVVQTAKVQPDGAAVTEMIASLLETLPQIAAFARENDLAGFADCFEKAQQCLNAEDPFSLVYHRDLAPDEALPIDAARLLAACQAAWVFGGMGSWNDLGFEGDHEKLYQRLSDRLFGLLNRAICVGVNASGDST